MKQLKMKQKKKSGFLGMVLGILGASLLGNLLIDKDTNRAGEITISARSGCLISPHPLTNFYIQKYYQNEPEYRYNGIYSRNNLPKIKDEVWVIN